MKNIPAVRIGTAGWSIPVAAKAAFPASSSQLETYANIFDGVEINSSFHRPHLLSTYQRWAAAVPETFRFAVKVPKAATHVRKLSNVETILDEFLSQIAGLGNKLGPLLVQLPPSFAFSQKIAEEFFGYMRAHVPGPIACEPRHASWFAPQVEEMFVELRIGRVAADPARVPQAGQAGGSQELTYCRLHGAPRVYWSSYSDQEIQAAIKRLDVSANVGSECWCIFDNTASGAATVNALTAKYLASLPKVHKKN